MNFTTRIAMLAALAAAACATAGGGGSRFHQADHAPPARSQFAEAERSMIEEAFNHAERAEQAAMSGNLDQARAEARVAADGFTKYVERFPSDEWRIVLLTMASDHYLRAQEWEKAAARAQQIVDDSEAKAVSKAVGARFAAGAWQMIANLEGRAGKIDPPRIVTADKRKGEPPKPRIPPLPWKRFIESADLYLSVRKSDPLAGLPAAERQKRGGVDAPQLALIAAQVEFGYDNMEEARRRFESIMQSWASRGDIMESAVPYYLQTFLVLKDGSGYEAAVPKALALVKPEAAKAAESAKAPGATEETKKEAEALLRLQGDLERQQQGAGFTAAERLLAGEKFAEAAALFEKFARENPDHPDAPNALHNAAVAWDKAKEPKKATAARTGLLERYPDSKVAPQATLAQASAFTRAGNHAAALKLYQGYLEKWGQGALRCLALQNLGVALESTGKRLEAARNYQTFARDAACLKEDPNNAAKVVYHAAVLFSDARKTGDAQELFRITAGIQGVTDTVARSQVEDAKTRTRKGK